MSLCHQYCIFAVFLVTAAPRSVPLCRSKNTCPSICPSNCRSNCPSNCDSNRPTDCPLIYVQLCARNSLGNTKTFDNDCIMEVNNCNNGEGKCIYMIFFFLSSCFIAEDRDPHSNLIAGRPPPPLAVRRYIES